MRYDKNELPVREYYTEELKKSPEAKMKALRYQKYYTGGSIILLHSDTTPSPFVFA